MPNEFHTALGQYLDYELGLEEQEPDRLIFLALPMKAFQKISQIPLLLKALNRFKVKVIIFNPDSEKIIQWLKN